MCRVLHLNKKALVRKTRAFLKRMAIRSFKVCWKLRCTGSAGRCTGGGVVYRNRGCRTGHRRGGNACHHRRRHAHSLAAAPAAPAAPAAAAPLAAAPPAAVAPAPAAPAPAAMAAADLQAPPISLTFVHVHNLRCRDSPRSTRGDRAGYRGSAGWFGTLPPRSWTVTLVPSSVRKRLFLASPRSLSERTAGSRRRPAAPDSAPCPEPDWRHLCPAH